MPTKAELETELAALRAELAQMAELRAEKSGSDQSTSSDPESSADENADNDTQAQLTAMVHDLTETAENHPGLALAGVFVVGVLFGRIIGR